MNKHDKFIAGIMAVAMIGTCSMGLVSCVDKEKTSSDTVDIEAEDSSWSLKKGVLKINSNYDYYGLLLGIMKQRA